jgi:hypothetical protein
MAKHSAAEIAIDLERGNNLEVTNRLADDYLELDPRDFRELVKDLGAVTKATAAPDVYSKESADNGLEVYINDGLFQDTRVFSAKPDLVPQSEPLKDDNLEQVARKFNEMLSETRNEFSYRTSMAAGNALLKYAQELPANEQTQLLQRAEEISLETGSTEQPALRITFSPDDGGENRIALSQAVLDIPVFCTNHQIYEGTARYKIFPPSKP